jgi:hypothetical protein
LDLGSQLLQIWGITIDKICHLPIPINQKITTKRIVEWEGSIYFQIKWTPRKLSEIIAISYDEDNCHH